MPIERHETTIAGTGYRMDTLGAVKGSAVALRVLPPMVAALSSALSRLEPGKSIDKLNWTDLAGAIGGAAVLLEKLSEADLKFICDAFAEKTTVGVTTPQEKAAGEETVRWFPLRAVFDDHFAGEYEALGQWLLWGIQVNRFLGRLSGSLTKAAASMAQVRQAPPGTAQEASPSTSPTGSTGSAGGP